MKIFDQVERYCRLEQPEAGYSLLLSGSSEMKDGGSVLLRRMAAGMQLAQGDQCVWQCSRSISEPLIDKRETTAETKDEEGEMRLHHTTNSDSSSSSRLHEQRPGRC